MLIRLLLYLTCVCLMFPFKIWPKPTENELSADVMIDGNSENDKYAPFETECPSAQILRRANVCTFFNANGSQFSAYYHHLEIIKKRGTVSSR